MGSVFACPEAFAIERFDKLAQAGVIHTGPSSATYCKVDGFEFEFRLRPSWSTKPRIPSESTSPVPAATFGPGSDILKSHPDQLLTGLSTTHIIALNIYPSSRPHFLLLTTDSYRRQDEPLDLQDVNVAWTLLHSLQAGADYYVMFNCAPESGCSRQHKHMQVLKRPRAAEQGTTETGFRFFPDVGGGSDEKPNVPYKYFLHRFARPGIENNTAADVYRVYGDFLDRSRAALGSARSPHNVILTTEWLLVIPRRYPENEAYMKLLPNGAGMMGMVSASEQEVIDEWMAEGPAKVLGAFGLPPDTET